MHTVSYRFIHFLITVPGVKLKTEEATGESYLPPGFFWKIIHYGLEEMNASFLGVNEWIKLFLISE